MILASRDKNGNVKYFDARTGLQYKPYRETGRYLGRIPNEVFRFLAPKVPDIVNMPSTRSDDPVLNKPNTNIYDKNGYRKNPNWLTRLWSWIKSLFGYGRK